MEESPSTMSPSMPGLTSLTGSDIPESPEFSIEASESVISPRMDPDVAAPSDSSVDELISSAVA